MADDTDPWTQRLQNIDKLMKQPAASAPAGAPAAPTATSTTTASTPPPADTMWDPFGLRAMFHPAATAFTGGAYNALSNIQTNVGLGTAPTLDQATQDALRAHPYAATAGSVVGAAPIAMGVGMGTPLMGAGLIGDVATGAATGAAQNILAGDPNESFGRRAVTGATVGGVLGGIGSKVGSWFGAGRAIEPEVADAAKVAQQEGVTDINQANLPGGNIKAQGATPTYAQSGQIDNAVSKILGDNVPNFSRANFNKVQNNIGSAVSKAANSGQINAQPGGAFDQALSQVQQYANSTGVGGSITPLINQIRGKIKNGIISGQDFDNLVGGGSTLHDLVGDDNTYVKQAAQALDKVMDSGFQASSPAGAYDNWVDARTKYRMLMGVQKALLPNGHVNPTTLFTAIQNRFTDLKGTPVTADPLVGRMGQFADSIKTLFGGTAAGAAQPGPSFLKQAATHLGIGSLPALYSGITSGDPLNPENYLTPQAIAGLATGLGGLGLRQLGQTVQSSQPFANALINRGGTPIGNYLTSPYVTAPAVQAFP